jgi:alkylation response protein AidB-like acyl-CoA dehydrogenase
MNSNYLQQILSKISANASEIDQEGCFPETAFKLLADAGLLEITLPGNELSYEQNHQVGVLTLLKSIGKASLPVGRIYEGHINALYLVHLFASQNQKDRWFKDVSLNQMLFGVWNTQDGEGVEIHSIGNGRYKLAGCKTFCSGANWINRPLVTGKLFSPDRSGWQMFIIPTEQVQSIKVDGSFWKPLGMRASASFRMDFTGIEISEDDLFGKPDAYYQQPHFTGGAIRFAAVQLGGAEAILQETLIFLKSMNRTDDLFQQARVAEMTYLIETGNLWLNQAGSNAEQWNKTPEAINKTLAYSNMMRTVVEDICIRCMQLAERSVGSRGLMRPQAMERIHRDLTTYLRQPAPDATLTAIGAYVLNQDTHQDIWQ